METLIKFIKFISFFSLMGCVLTDAYAAEPVVDVKHIGESQKLLTEARKQTESTQGILKKSENILGGVEDLNETLGKPTEVGVNAFGWINSTTGSVNNALQACGIAGAIPPIQGISLPGLDMPNLDFSCMTSAIDAVQSGLFTYERLKNDRVVITGSQNRRDAIANNRAHYSPRNEQEIRQNRMEYEEKAVLNVLAGANRISSSSGFVNETEAKLVEMGGTPHKINDLLRINISVGLAQFQQLKELNAQLAAFANMMAAERVHKFPPREAED